MRRVDRSFGRRCGQDAGVAGSAKAPWEPRFGGGRRRTQRPPQRRTRPLWQFRRGWMLPRPLGADCSARISTRLLDRPDIARAQLAALSIGLEKIDLDPVAAFELRHVVDAVGDEHIPRRAIRSAQTHHPRVVVDRIDHVLARRLPLVHASGGVPNAGSVADAADALRFARRSRRQAQVQPGMRRAVECSWFPPAACPGHRATAANQQSPI